MKFRAISLRTESIREAMQNACHSVVCLRATVALAFFLVVSGVATGCGGGNGSGPEDTSSQSGSGLSTVPTLGDSASNDEAEGPWQRARDRGATLRAIGQEPGWFVEVYGADSLVAVLDYGQERHVFMNPLRTENESDVLFDARESETDVSVRVISEPCTDVMSGEEFDARVELTLDAQIYRGCGRAL